MTNLYQKLIKSKGRNRPSKSLPAFVSEFAVSWVIIVNTAVLYLDAFPYLHKHSFHVFTVIDYACTLYFIAEVILKIRLHGWNAYISKGWNRFDFSVVVASLPSLLTPFMDAHIFAGVLVFRVARLLRFLRFARFMPNGPKIWAGILRSLRASVGIFAALLLLNLMFAMGATLLFGHLAPEYFGDPLVSSYSLFKVFTIEGWYQIPDLLIQRGDSIVWAIFLRLYFIVAVIIGGVLGLSLANAVFVGQMTSDNTVALERRLSDLRRDMRALHADLKAIRGHAHRMNGNGGKNGHVN